MNIKINFVHRIIYDLPSEPRVYSYFLIGKTNVLSNCTGVIYRQDKWVMTTSLFCILKQFVHTDFDYPL